MKNLFLLFLFFITSCAGKDYNQKPLALFVYTPCETETKCVLTTDKKEFHLENTKHEDLSVIDEIETFQNLEVSCKRHNVDYAQEDLSKLYNSNGEYLFVAKNFPLWVFSKMANNDYLCRHKNDKDEGHQKVECRVFPHLKEKMPKGWFSPSGISVVIDFLDDVENIKAICKNKKDCDYNSCYPSSFFND
jgi:hypothetical protein